MANDEHCAPAAVALHSRVLARVKCGFRIVDGP